MQSIEHVWRNLNTFEPREEAAAFGFTVPESVLEPWTKARG
jgi:hypothetical protein